ncbi:hypothetical protein BKA93DRAFT_730214, partial [Sparassis latifolia]
QQRMPQKHLLPITGRDALLGTVPPESQNVHQIVPGGKRPFFCALPCCLTLSHPTGTLPAGAAPGSNTVIDCSPFATPTAVCDTLTGAMSKDVHTGLGHPGSGMSSAEMHHNGKPHRKRDRTGTGQYGGADDNRDVDLNL